MNKIQLALAATVLAGASMASYAESTSSADVSSQSTAATNQESGLQDASLQETREVAAQFVDDSVITARVVNALMAEPDVSKVNLSIETVDGVVSLSGEAANEAEHQRAVQIVRALDDVCDVQDNIQTSR